MKNTKFLTLGILLTSAVLLSACQQGALPTVSTTPSVPASAPVAGTAISISGNAFTPNNLLVKVGQKVTWTNNDSYAHTVTADNKSFDSGSLPSGQSYSFTFTKAGTVTYHCTVHPYMTGTITVQ